MTASSYTVRDSTSVAYQDEPRRSNIIARIARTPAPTAIAAMQISEAASRYGDANFAAYCPP